MGELLLKQDFKNNELPSEELFRLFSNFNSQISCQGQISFEDASYAVGLSRELRSNSLIGQSLYFLAYYNYKSENFQKALILLDESQKLLQKESKPLHLLQSVELSGKIYFDLEDYEMALQMFFEAMQLANNNLALEYYKAKLFHQIGLTFKETRDFDSAVTYFRKYLEVSEKYEKANDIAHANFELGNILTWTNQLGEAGIYLKKAITLSQAANYKNIEVFAVVSTAILSTKLKKYDKAKELFDEAFHKAIEINNEVLIANILKSKAKLFIETNNCEDAIMLLDEARVLAEKLKQNSVLAMIFQFYTQAYEQLKNYEKALLYNRLNFALEKKSIEERSKSRVQTLQMKFEMEEVVKENEIFKLKNVVLQQANDKISKQKNEIETIHKDITASINYASKIQQAILPRKEEIAEKLKKHFVMWKPCNVVSGDFYWYFNAENYAYVAAVDCTGHGVPGALMSMIGNTLLNELVNANKSIEPAELLYLLNLEIKKALRQEINESENNDGMDIAVCRIDMQNGEMIFSGANRPIYLLKSGSLEIEEYKSDKGSIGGFHSNNERNFIQHKIQLNKKDRVYLFTDGITDQFGSETGKKLRAINFRNWVKDAQQIEIEEQRDYFVQKMEDWQGSESQVDDMLLIAFEW